ncbi:MAG: hypothetical protein MJZ37_00310 [Bacilli bacterium]|nr:hypothetical protein [Bacilli bacterium]
MSTTKEKITVMTAYEEGKKIECKSRDCNWAEWILPQEPAWNWAECDYRIKEEPKYRPYKDIDELFNDWAEKTHSIPANMEQLVRPLIWVESKVTGIERLITTYDRHAELVKIAKRCISLEYLFNNYTFLDESPCGKKE